MTGRFKCGSAKICKVWENDTYKDACTFSFTSDVYVCRNINCTLPVEIVLGTLIEDEYDR